MVLNIQNVYYVTNIVIHTQKPAEETVKERRSLPYVCDVCAKEKDSSTNLKFSEMDI